MLVSFNKGASGLSSPCTVNLLGYVTSGPPSSFLINGKLVRKQQELADDLAECYTNKVSDVKKSLPGVNYDPLQLLRRVFRRWKPAGGKPSFVLK